MTSAWVAVDGGVDPPPGAGSLHRAYRLTDSGSSAPTIVRPVVFQSWQRSERASVDPAERAPIVLDREEARRAFERHRLAQLLDIVRSVLVTAAEYAPQVVAISNAEGLLLWTGGHAQTLTDAERVHLIPGALWSEAVAGTNALGTAIALDHPVQIFSAEHFKQSMHGWSTAAAPIHDPESGEIIGVVGLSGPLKAAHPHGFSLVVAAVQIIEAHLAHEAAQRDERLKVKYLERILRGCSDASAVVNSAGTVLLAMPPGWLGRRLRVSEEGVPVLPCDEEANIEPLDSGQGYLVLRGARGKPPAGRPALFLETLGRERVRASLHGQQIDFSPRHSEILVILARHPDGLSEEELAAELYGSATKSVTIRAEISRLRKLLGPIVRTRPYRLAAEVRPDFLEIDRLLCSGRAEAASERYSGPLLSSSIAPGIVQIRDRLHAGMRTAHAPGVKTAARIDSGQ